MKEFILLVCFLASLASCKNKTSEKVTPGFSQIEFSKAQSENMKELKGYKLGEPVLSGNPLTEQKATVGGA